MELKCRTYNNQSSENCSRVFFCCHRDDFDKHFDDIAEDIFKYQNNAAIYYYEPTDEVVSDEDFFFNLSNMKLFVIPVTTKFLTEESTARTVAFPFALEKNIPVLPLIQEPGLEPLFNEVCGNIQCIDKTVLMGDLTAIPYDRKMQQFLESVLVGDELAKRIQGEFADSIFLSYRKKDRKYAREIMNVIHNYQSCWDVQIWYDEFLTPGEDFNNSIREKLAKSILFVLAVTPNLLENPNYVMAHEYPEAYGLSKKILPIEAVDTDRLELEAAYEHIRNSISLNDREGLNEYLSDVFAGNEEKTQAAESKAGTHYFLIGLAYHSGIGMEINHERGIRLITVAAEMGIPEASRKLSAIYKLGDGVQVDYRQAIRWMNIYCEQEKGAKKRLEAYLELAEMYRLAAEYNDNCEVLKKALQLAKEINREQDTRQTRQTLAAVYAGLGKVYSFLSTREDDAGSRDILFDEAMNCFSEAIAIEEQLLQTEWEQNGAVQFIESISFYGRLCCNREDGFEEGRRMFQKGFAQLKLLLQKQVHPDIREYYQTSEKMAYDLARGYHSVPAVAWGLFLLGEGAHLIDNYRSTGTWLSQFGELDLAEEYFLQGMEYAAKRLEKQDSVVVKTDLMYLADDFAEYYLNCRNDKDKSDEYYFVAYELATELCERIGSAQFFNCRKRVADILKLE